MTNEGISVADALALRNSGSSDNGWGDGNAWWIIILVLLFAGGWNRNGFGGYGGGNDGGNMGAYFPAYNPCCSPATAQGVADAFNFNQLDNGIRGLERGMCDGFYSTNNAINAVSSALQNCCCETQQSIANLGFQTQQGFCGVDKSIMQNGYNMQAGFNALGNQLASCCCDLERGQENIKYTVAQSTNSIIAANDKNTDRIINYLTQTEMDKLRTELQSAQFQLSQLSQTSNIVNQLMPVAKPAYLTCSPYASAFGINPGYNYNGCGCNTGCCA